MPDADERTFPARALAAALLCILLASAPASAQDGAGDTLQPQDRIVLKIGEWDPVTETYTGWPDLGGTYRIGASGRFSVPMAGEMEAAGLTPAQLADEIAARLTRRMGHSGQIEAAVSLESDRPVYVLGAVKAPGAYEYAPGLTVLQGLSLAGGLKGGETAFLRSERSALSALGDYRVMELDLMRSLATVARIEAELQDADGITPPPRIAEAPMGEEFLAREREIFEARESSFETSLGQLADLERLLHERIARLEEQIELRDEQLRLAREELDSASQLVERGLSVESRRSSLQRLVADQEVRRLQLETAKLNAEQQLNEVGRDRSNLINDRRRALVEDLRAQRTEIARLEVRMETQAALYSEALQYGDGFMQMETAGEPVYRVTRISGGESEVLEVGRGAPLRPGDVLEVSMPGPEGAGPSAAAGQATGTPEGTRPPPLAPLPSGDVSDRGADAGLAPLESAFPGRAD